MGPRWLQGSRVIVLFTLLSCGSSGKQPGPDPNQSNAQPATNAEICNCTPTVPDSEDYRHAAKHVSLPAATGQDTTIAEILQWPTTSDPAPDAPRSDRELQMFHIPISYVQFVWLVPNDCDIHFELSDTPDPNAARMIVETPGDPEYCPTRQNEVAGLARYGVPVSTNGYNLQTPVQAEVLGLAFQDSDHARGTRKVATVWELHPAVVTIK